jgi:hypothetical protein
VKRPLAARIKVTLTNFRPVNPGRLLFGKRPGPAGIGGQRHQMAEHHAPYPARFILVQYLGLQRGPPGSCRRGMVGMRLVVIAMAFCGPGRSGGSAPPSFPAVPLRRVAAHGQPTPIVLDLMHPIRAGRRTGGEGGKAGFHESCGNFPARDDIGPMAACFDQPQSSSCRGAENIELLETAKKHKIAALTTLMISRGVFSRDHISTLPTGCQRLGCTRRALTCSHCCRSRSVIV